MILSPILKEKLAFLRADPQFQDILKAMPRTRILPYVPNTDTDKATTGLIYASGKVAGEKALLIWLLGYDPDDRQSE